MPKLKHNSLSSIEEDFSLGNQLYGGGQHIALYVASLARQLLRAQSMVHSDHVLLNNWSLIQIAGHEMSSGTDDLDTAIICLVVGLGTLEGGQEAVVDVDDLAGHLGAKQGRKHLHVSCKDNEVNIVLLDQLQDASFLCGLGLSSDWQVDKWDLVRGGEGLKIKVIGNDEGNLDLELSC